MTHWQVFAALNFMGVLTDLQGKKVTGDVESVSNMFTVDGHIDGAYTLESFTSYGATQKVAAAMFGTGTTCSSCPLVVKDVSSQHDLMLDVYLTYPEASSGITKEMISDEMNRPDKANVVPYVYWQKAMGCGGIRTEYISIDDAGDLNRTTNDWSNDTAAYRDSDAARFVYVNIEDKNRVEYVCVFCTPDALDKITKAFYANRMPSAMVNLCQKRTIIHELIDDIKTLISSVCVSAKSGYYVNRHVKCTIDRLMSAYQGACRQNRALFVSLCCARPELAWRTEPIDTDDGSTFIVGFTTPVGELVTALDTDTHFALCEKFRTMTWDTDRPVTALADDALVALRAACEETRSAEVADSNRHMYIFLTGDDRLNG